jgi:hypothetical protein
MRIFNEDLLSTDKDELESGTYYLVRVPGFSPSSYTIAELINGELICCTSGYNLFEYQIEGFIELQ